MSLDRYKLGKDSAGNNYSSLDHGALTISANYSQYYGYSCGIFTLLMMIMRRKGEIGYLQHAYTKDKLNNYRL